MTISSHLRTPWEDGTTMPSLPLPITSLPSEPLPYAVVAILFLAAVISIHHSTSRTKDKDNTRQFPLLNPKRFWEFTPKRVQMEYHMNSTTMILEGVKKYAGEPFRLWTLEYGQVLVLPPRYANEIKNDVRFSFAQLTTKRLHSHLPGFHFWEMLGQENRIIQRITQENLTPSIAQLGGPISKECALALEERLPNDSEWHDVAVKSTFIEIVARLSTLAFSGLDLARNSEWIELTTNYTMVLLHAAVKLNEYPYYLRRLANMIVPECRALRASERRARRIVDGKLAERRRQREEGDETKYNDVLEWFDKEHQKLGGMYEPTVAQLVLSFTAIHTSTDLLSEVILELARHPELFGPLRGEIQEALGTGEGLTKATVQRMKLLDSAIKETQRLKPMQNLFMERRVMEDATLSGNIQLQRDSVTLIISPMRNPDVYDKPDEYDAYRFYRQRQQPGKQHTSQLVTTSPDYLAFGHGTSACPGRFFAAHEIKVVLCHLLLKYDWHLPDGADAFQRITAGNSPNVSPMAKIVIRRRDESEVERSKVVI